MIFLNIDIKKKNQLIIFRKNHSYKNTNLRIKANCYAVMQIERHNSQNIMRFLSDFEKCTVIND